MSHGRPPLASLTPADAGKVLPLVRGFQDSDVEDANSVRLSGDSALIAEPFVADLRILYVADFDVGYRYVSQGDLKGLALSDEALADKAWENLLAKCQRMEMRVHAAGRTNMITIGENLEPSLLMVAGLWRSFASQARGRLVAACPSRDVLVFCDMAIEGALAEMREGSTRVWAGAGNERISQALLEWREDGWLPLEE